MRKQLIIFLLLISLIIPIFSFAEGLPTPSADFYVYDKLGVLDKETVNYIININKELEKQTGSQVVVAVVKSLQDRKIEDYRLDLFREWQIGDGDKNNGVLLLVSPNDKKVRIEVGYGLEGAIPDSKAGDILDTFILPKFKEENYDRGIKDGFSAIVGLIAKEYDIELEDLDNVDISEKALIGFILFILFVTILAIVVTADGDGFSSGGGFGSGGGSSFGGGGSCGGGGASGGW